MNNDAIDDTIEEKQPTKRFSVLTTLRRTLFTLLLLAIAWTTLRYVLAPMFVSRQQANVPSTELVELKQRVDVLEKTLADIKNAPADHPTPASIDIAPLEQRLRALEEMAKSPVPPQPEAGTEALPTPPVNIAEIEALKAEIADLKKTDHAYVRSVILIGQLQNALNEGRPFGRELDTLTALRPDMAEKLGPLAEYAPLGVPTLAFIKDEFKQTIDRALRTEEHDKTLSGNLRSLVKIRKVGEQSGQDDEAIIARAETRIAEGKVESALQEVESLSEPASKAFAAWRAHAQAYLTTQHTMNMLADALAGSTAP